MTGASGSRCGSRIVNRTGARLYGIAGYCLFAAGLAGLVGGCGGGDGDTLAPVESLGESVIPGVEGEHVVVKGDTVYSIAWRHGVDYRALARANAIRDPFTIYPGQRIRIPEPGSIAAVSVPEAADPQPKRERKPLPPPPPKSISKPAAESSREAEGAVSRPAAEAAHRTPPKASGQQPKAEPKQPKSRQPAKRVEKQPAAAAVAGLRWMWPAKGKMVGGFTRGGGKGIDIAGTFEQPISAAARGQVVYAGSGLIGYGKLVIVKHNNRLLSAYAHNERLHVQEGEAVKGGQHIADMGHSSKGRVMLHFEIRRDGKPVDPLRFLPR